MAIEYLTMKEAGRYLGVSRATIWKIVKDGVVATYTDPVDKRKTLIRKDDLDKFRLLQTRG